MLVIVISGTWFSRSVPWTAMRDLCLRQLVPEVKSQRKEKPRVLAGVSAHSVLLFCFYFLGMGSRCVTQTLGTCHAPVSTPRTGLAHSVLCV